MKALQRKLHRAPKCVENLLLAKVKREYDQDSTIGCTNPLSQQAQRLRQRFDIIKGDTETVAQFLTCRTIFFDLQKRFLPASSACSIRQVNSSLGKFANSSPDQHTAHTPSLNQFASRSAYPVPASDCSHHSETCCLSAQTTRTGPNSPLVAILARCYSEVLEHKNSGLVCDENSGPYGVIKCVQNNDDCS